MTRPLTDLQRSVIQRLNVVGLEDFATRAITAWSEGQKYPCALTPAERATMEGATLCDDYKNANADALKPPPPR